LSREDLLRETAEDFLFEEAHRRRFLYKDVEELIEHGFLTYTLSLGPELVVGFRSLLPEDTQRLKVRAVTDDDYVRWFVAASVCSVNGYEIPVEHASDGSYTVYQEWIRDAPEAWVTALSVYPMALKERVLRALRITEAYCYEPYGRSAWRLLGKPLATLRNGNRALRIWSAFNIAEDDSEANRRTWTHTQTVVGSMTNKGSKQIREMLDRWEVDEKASRQEVVEKAVNWVIRGDAPPAEPIKINFQGQEVEVGAVTSPRSRHELEEEMRKVMEGEMDLHDSMVEDYHRRARIRVDALRATKARERDEAQLAREAASMGNPAALVGYTKEQLDRINPSIGKKKTQVVPENSDAQRLYERYVAPKIVAGVLNPDMRVTDASAQKEKGGGVSLQEKVEARKPQAKK
jgi:hypothetical protein